VKMRGLAIGIQTAGAGVGMMVMPPILEKLIASNGWRTTFVILGIASFIIFSVAAIVVRGDPAEKGLLPYGVTKSKDQKDAVAERVVIARRPAAPGRDLSLKEAMRDKDLWLLTGMRAFIAMVIFMVNLHLVNYATDAGMSAAGAAMLMSIVGGVSIVGKIGAGHIVDRIGSKKIILVCTSVLVMLMLWLASPMGTSMLQIAVAVYGLAYGGSYALFNTIIAETFGVTEIGKMLGVANVGTAVGSLVGPWLAGFTFDSTGSYAVAFVTAAGASLIALILAIPVGKGARQPVGGEESQRL
jgi:OFA family oxalate/formate antiporter-like MFS transporter